MKTKKGKKVFVAVASVVFLAVFFCSKTTKAFEDNTAPEVLSFSMTPIEVDTSEEDQIITATMRVTDAGVGFCVNGATGCSSSNNSSAAQIDFAPLIGTSTQQRNFSNLTRISGDDNDGIWQATTTLPRGSKVGIWEVGPILGVFVTDAIGNQRLYSGDQAYANTYGYDYLGTIPNVVRMIANTATSDSVTIQKEWTLSSSNVSATFPANTVVTKNDGGSFAFYQMVNQDFNIGDVTSNGLDSADVSNIAGKIKIGIPGLNLSFSNPVTLEFNVGSEYDGQTLEIQTLEESGSSWANETTCAVSGGKCSFTVDHASYFAAIKTTASSTSNGIVTGSTNGSIVIGTDTPTLGYSKSKKAKKRINLTFNGLSMTKKKWVKVRLNGRKATVQRVKKIGNDTIVRIYVKYKKWAVGSYNLSMTYKNKIKVPYTTKKGKTKYRKVWESGNVTSQNILSII